jgi:hypothetical protein
VVVLLTLAAFWLPPHAGEKVVLNAFTALIICLMLLSFSQKLPAMASHTPLISEYLFTFTISPCKVTALIYFIQKMNT